MQLPQSSIIRLGGWKELRHRTGYDLQFVVQSLEFRVQRFGFFQQTEVKYALAGVSEEYNLSLWSVVCLLGCHLLYVIHFYNQSTYTIIVLYYYTMMLLTLLYYYYILLYNRVWYVCKTLVVYTTYIVILIDNRHAAHNLTSSCRYLYSIADSVLHYTTNSSSTTTTTTTTTIMVVPPQQYALRTNF